MTADERVTPLLADGSTVLETRGLKKTYMQGKVPVHALRGVDLAVKEGELIAILGPSGSGKSTLLNMIGALDRPSAGTIIIEQQDISKLNKNQLAEVRRNVGFVFQYFNLIGRLTALQNVELPMTIKGMGGAQRRQKATDLLDLVGLGDRVKHKPSELSGGQQQRVAIARALAQDPRFMLMDEPTGNIDTKTRDAILELIKRLNAEKRVTTVMITHDASVARIARRTLYIVDGLLYNTQEEAIIAEETHQALEIKDNGDGSSEVRV
ncbi:MAG: ABC transporter ATP-binding protein [Candidatus Lokiarchaeota archaeon]|nr:ABC transporter ATP-binding protein [Candidatus Lokiarchaeota archaeon]